MLVNSFWSGATGYIVDDYSPEYCWTVERVDLADTDLVNVRRSGDSAESAFNGTEISDGSLVTWVVAGGGTEDGLVVDWYNVGTAGALTLTQATATEQPKLVSGGVLNTKNSQPSVLYDGSNDENSNVTDIINTVPFSVFAVGSCETSVETGILLSNRRAGSDLGGWLTNASRNANKNNFVIDLGASTAIWDLISQTNNNNLRLNTFTINSSDEGESWLDSVSQDTATTATTYNTASTKTIMMGGQGAGTTRSNVNVSMILVWDSDETSNRTDIETAINAIYSTY
jgi:hypothetical protein